MAETTAREGTAAPPSGPPVRVGRAVWLSVATMASRVLGLARDQLFAIVIGANVFSDAFVVAFRIPNLLRDLFAEGALSSAFVPAFADAHRNAGREAAYRLGNAVVALVLLVVGALTLLGVAFSGSVVAVIAPGLGERALASLLTKIMMPFLLLVSLSAVAMGMLNAQSRFTVPALAPALFNVGSIGVGALLWAAGWPPDRAVVGWAVGTMVGGFLQLAVQIPALRVLGYRARLRLAHKDVADPRMRRIWRLMAMAVLGLSATNVNVFVNTIFASHVVGGNTWLQMAFRLMQLPLGVFGVAIATVAGAGVAQRAAARDMPGVKQTIGSAMRLVGFLNVPSAIGLTVLATPIVSLLYQHGRFDAADANATAQALVLYALDEARVPVVGSIVGMVSNVVLNAALFPVLGFRGVALGTSLAAAANFAVLAFSWRRKHGGLGGSGIVPQLFRVTAASAVLAAVAWASEHALVSLPVPPGIGRQLVLGLVPVAAGGLAYLVAARALRIRELGELADAVRRRRR